MDHLIRNCHFKFKCSMTWDLLNPTDDPVVRHCGGCQRDVYLCRTDRELVRAMREDYCVAIPGEASDYPGTLAPLQMTLGNVAADYWMNEDDLSED